jgi:methyltransferase-like protein
MAELTGGEAQASTFNLWNETHMLSPVDRYLLPLLDGSRDRDALVEALLVVDRETPIEIDIERNGKPVSGEAERRAALTELVDELPQRLTEMKLLRAN